MKAYIVIAGLAASLVSPPALAAHWSVDYARSRLGFSVQWSNEAFAASFKSWKADIDFDPTDLAHARADVTIALGSEVSGEPDFDEGLKGALGFQVAQFPSAHFVATSFTHQSGDRYVATGKLSLHGMTKDVTLPFSLTLEGGHAHMKGSAEVIRTDYGVGEGEWAAPTPVEHEVTVTIDIVATRL